MCWGIEAYAWRFAGPLGSRERRQYDPSQPMKSQIFRMAVGPKARSRRDSGGGPQGQA